MTERKTRQTSRKLLHNRWFAALFAAQAISDFGDWLSRVALFSLIAFHAKGSALAVSGIVMAFTVPVAAIGPVAGVLVDRWDLKRTMIASDMIRAVLVMMLPFAQGLFEVYLLIFALSSVSVFFSPAQMSTHCQP